MLREISNILLYWAAIVSSLSVILHLTGPWRSTLMGRHLLAYMGSLSCILVLISFRNLVGEFRGYDYVRTIVFATVPIVMTGQLLLQLRARRGVIFVNDDGFGEELDPTEIIHATTTTEEKDDGHNNRDD